MQRKPAVPRIVALGGGKSTVAINLALALARLGHRVTLVDADLGAERTAAQHTQPLWVQRDAAAGEG